MADGAPHPLSIGARSGAFKRGFASWSAGDRDDEFGPHALAALGELRTATAALG